MAVSVCGQRGQLAVRRVGLVPSPGPEPAITPSLIIMDKTAPGTTVKLPAVKLHPVPVRKNDLYNSHGRGEGTLVLRGQQSGDEFWRGEFFSSGVRRTICVARGWGGAPTVGATVKRRAVYIRRGEGG